jgi:hypothetical protein
MGEPIALPAGVRLVHIGPHKTGTTALQRAMHRSREALHEQGVHYAYPTVQAYKPAIGLTGLRGRRGGPVAGPEDWNVLVEEVRAAGEMRVVVSSESLANADTEHIVQLRDDLGADRVHVVRMVRRYDKLVPSQWQQQLLNGRRISLDGFCTRLLDPDSSFWLRHGFATLTRRWAEVVGPDNLTVVVVDEDDPRWLLHVFERMLSLRDGTLPLPPGRPNRSLSLAEAETLRKVNVAIAKAGWSDRVIHHYVREGVSAGFKRIPSDARAGRPRLSRDLHERLAAATSRDVDDLLALGVHVVGDVGRLAIPPWQGDDGQGSNGPVTLAPASVASAVLGVVRMAEDPVPLYGTPGAATSPASGASEGVRARLRPRRPVTMLAPEGAAGDFARGDGADGPGAHTGRAGRVLLTVVPPWQLLAARWQAGLLDGDVTEYAAWLDDHPEAWELPDLLAQARGLATPRRITVVVGDARFPGTWTESAAGVRRDRLPDVRRSLLTWPEAEWLRELNVRAREDGLPDERRRHALAGALRWALGHQPGTDPGAHPLRGDQLARAQALGRELRTALEHARVDVRGDLDELTGLRPATAPPRLAPRPASWPILGAIASADVRRA